MKKQNLFITSLLTLLFSIVPAAAECALPEETASGIPQSEYAALYALYQATDGDNWTENDHWLSTYPAYTWHGITVQSGHVTGVVLSSNNLKGSIPPEMGNLSQLVSLMLDSNQLTGEIPSELGDISTLVLLWLDGNSLTGDLPLFLANPPDYLDLRYNQLTASDQSVLDAVESSHTYKFSSTQTLAPGNIIARVSAFDGKEENRVELSWDPIRYTDDEGGYQVFFKKKSDPDYLYYGMTADKTASSITIPGLDPSAEYDFKAKTVTWAHDYQKQIPS